jgi:hypothetical protein
MSAGLGFLGVTGLPGKQSCGGTKNHSCLLLRASGSSELLRVWPASSDQTCSRRCSSQISATTENIEAINQCFNVAVGERTTLNQLFEMLRERLLPQLPHLREFKPFYDDFRRGDVRHSHADISKARRLLNYEPMHHIEQGLDEALGWYLANLAHRAICEGAVKV